MAAVYRSGRREARHLSCEPSQRISPLVILQARFQQKQLQQKEEKLLKLFQEQQERALKSVGSRSHSGGSSISSTSSVGVGKVRHMFQSRRENSEPRLAASITGRDKSHPLLPLTNDRHHVSTEPPPWEPSHHLTWDRHNIRLSRHHNANQLDLHHSHNRPPLRTIDTRTHNENPRATQPNSGHSFRLLDDHAASPHPTKQRHHSPPPTTKPLQHTRHRDDPDHPTAMENRYKTYVSQTTFAKKPHLGNPASSPRTALPPKEPASSASLNGTLTSPVRKIRKPTPVPLSVAPPQHLLQKEITKRIHTIKEVPTSAAPPKAVTSRAQSLTGTLHKPPSPARTSPSARAPPAKSVAAPTGRSPAPPPSDLVNCRICGRHFAADRVSKHEEVCQKSTRNKRKPFDALQQRVKGTEVEQYIKKSTKLSRTQPEKAAKPQSNWRKKHEEFINNIRAAKEVTAHLKKGGKLSDLPPPPPSDYSDYVPCPHCGRKFNSSAAERHIPKCANIINNKPKANLQKTTGLKQSSRLLHPPSTSLKGRK